MSETTYYLIEASNPRNAVSKFVEGKGKFLGRELEAGEVDDVKLQQML